MILHLQQVSLIQCKEANPHASTRLKSYDKCLQFMSLYQSQGLPSFPQAKPHEVHVLRDPRMPPPPPPPSSHSGPGLGSIQPGRGRPSYIRKYTHMHKL